MKIAIWIYRLGGGGAERVVSELSSLFADQGHEVSLLVHSDDNPYQHLLSPQVQLINIGRNIAPYLKPKTLFCLPALLRFLKQQQPDIVFTTGAQHGTLLLALAKFFTLPGIKIVRETNTLSAQNQGSAKLFDKMALWLAQHFYPKADAIIAPSCGVQRDLEQHIAAIADKIKVIPNPVNFDDIHAKSLEPLSTPFDQQPFMLGVGRLVPQKGYDLLLRAWAPLYRKNNIRLVILGDGPERSSLEKLAQDLGVADGFFLPGFDRNPFRYMARAKLFVLSSYYEGLPNTLLQALACGCPVVATDCPSGPHEILHGGAYGTLVPVGDVEALSKAIEDAFDGRDDNAQQSLTQDMRQTYGAQQVAAQYLALFEQACADQKGGR